MENVVFTQLSIPELRQIFRQELESHFASQKENQTFVNRCERLTIAQLVEQYKISKATIHNLMKAGKIAFEKIGRKTLFAREDVEAYFNSKKKQLNKSFGTTLNSMTKTKGGSNA